MKWIGDEPQPALASLVHSLELAPRPDTGPLIGGWRSLVFALGKGRITSTILYLEGAPLSSQR